ncbi:MAG: hypothetical protein KAS72_01205 [Phycisphaerales bacterium]|nr:hypothetical protein [Phycisphaerales bacterium]
MTHRRGTTACAALVVLVAACTHADIRHVPGDYPTIQEAIDAVIEGDEVVVAPGTYYETIELPAVPCTIRSSDGPSVTIIDAQQAGRVVNGHSETGGRITLCGFTITNGLADIGGGLRSEGRPLTIEECIFEHNNATYQGGGAYIRTVMGDTYLTRCRFDSNWAEMGGGGLRTLSSASFSVVLRECTFTENVTLSSGGAIQTLIPTVLIDCEFLDNGTFYFGGAVDFDSSSTHSLTVSNCKFVGNFASYGGAISAYRSGNVELLNCLLIANLAQPGGAIFQEEAALHVANTTFVGNEAAVGSSVYGLGSTVAIMNSIFWPADGHAIVSAPRADVRFSNIQGGYPGPGNISADPMFVDPLGPDGFAGTEDDDLRLLPGSPCIDAGCNYGVPFDEFDLDGDGDTAEFLPLDFDGNARFLDDPATPDTGCGATAVVDMGAFEFGDGDVVMPCVGDLDGDRIVGQSDLGLLLSAYGWTAVGDLTCDGITDQADLGILLAEYGQTCE